MEGCPLNQQPLHADERLLGERLRNLVQATPSSIVATALAGLVVVGLLAQGGSASVAGGWYSLLVAALGWRAWLARRSHDGSAREWRVQLHRHRLAFGLHGLAWASLLPAMMLQPAQVPLTGVVFVWTAMTGGALVTGAFDLRAALTFAAVSGASLAAAVLGGLGKVEPQLALAATVFVLMMAMAGRRAARQFEAQVEADASAAARLQEARRHADDAESARRELAQQHALMQQLLRGTSQGYWFVAPDGRTLDANPAMCELLGRSRDELLGSGALDVFGPAGRERMTAELERRRLGQRGAYEMIIERPDGSVRYAVNQATPILDDQGGHIGSIGLWTDVTPLKALEAELRTYERATNSIDDLLSVIGPDGRYRLVNDAWCQLVGRTRDQVIGEPWLDTMRGLLAQERADAFEDCRREGRVTLATAPVRLPDGREVVLQTRFFPYRDDAAADADGARSVILVTRDITEQERSRSALETAAEYLRQVLNATGDAIYATDAESPDEPMRFANQQLLDLVALRGVTPESLTPAALRSAAAAVYADPEVEQRQVAAIAAGWERHEGLVRLRDGRIIYRRFEPALVAGRKLRVWSFRDVTAEQQAMSLLHDREAEQRALLDAFPGYISRFDLQLRYTYVNEPLARLAGRPAADLLGRHVSEVIGRRRGRDLEALMQEVLAGRPRSIERDYHGPQGSVTVQMTLAAGTDPRSGEPVLYAFGADISELKRAEQRLRESEREMRALMMAFPGHIAGVDEQGRYTFMDASLARMLGYEPDAVVGRTLSDVIGPERAAQVEREQGLARQGQTVEAERRYPDGAGGWVDLAIRQVAGPRAPDGRQVVYTFSLDITARKRAELALAAALEEADRANRAKSQFLSHMSHELRTPMNAILGFAQLLLRDTRPALAPRQKGYAQQILRGAQHLLELINEVLDLGRIEAGRLEVDLQPVAAAEVAADCLAFVRELARSHGVALRPTLGLERPDGSPDPMGVVADRTRLRQVLLNLLANAIKYNRPDGEVQLRLRRDGGQVVIEVHDTGRGIAPEALGRLFTPFERLDAQRGPVEGTGIGLALSRRLVEAMQGQMGVDSRPGEGSVFWLRLPAQAMQPLSLPSPPIDDEAGPPEPEAPQRDVLYIDDNAVNLLLVESVLAQVPGIRLHCARRPQEGLAAAIRRPPHLVLLDIHMPEMDGYAVLARLKAHAATAAVPVVAVSADATPGDIEAARAAGFAAYLTKPLDVEVLIEAVQRLSQPGQDPAAGET
jgi:PAS domain S-box-containing protein